MVLAGTGAAFLAGCGRGGGAGRGALRVGITGKGENDARLLFSAAGIVPDFPITYAEFDPAIWSSRRSIPGRSTLAG
jgi:sulfonate transport system substrate-binding protein